MPKTSRGFTLIELLIVIAIILIIAAIAIPNLLRSRIAANQASAVGSLRTYVTSEATYSSTYNVGYSADLISLGPPTTSGVTTGPTAAGLVDSVLAGYSSPTSATPVVTSCPAGATCIKPADQTGDPFGTTAYAEKSGYVFQYTPITADGAGKIDAFQIYASPIMPGLTGSDYYMTDASGVIRTSTDSSISYTSSPLAG